MADLNIDAGLRSYFHVFWDKFPVPVLLIHRDHTILDCNPVATATGCVPGTRCIDRGERSAHKGCLAIKALNRQTAMRSVRYVKSMKIVMDGYWVPLPDHADMYVHFGNDITPYAAGHMLDRDACEPAACESCTVA